MKSKSILQRKPELIVVALLGAFLLSGTAAADINPPMVSIGAMGDYLYSEIVSLLWIVILIMGAVGSILIAFGGASHRAKASGYVIVTGCLVATAIFYVLPWVIHEMQAVATTGNNTAST